MNNNFAPILVVRLASEPDNQGHLLVFSTCKLNPSRICKEICRGLFSGKGHLKDLQLYKQPVKKVKSTYIKQNGHLAPAYNTYAEAPLTSISELTVHINKRKRVCSTNLLIYSTCSYFVRLPEPSSILLLNLFLLLMNDLLEPLIYLCYSYFLIKHSTRS